MAPQQTLFEGRCRGGPLDGQPAVSRFPAGFLLADKPAGKAWIYDRSEDGSFVARPDAPDLDLDKAVQTALGDAYDVIAAAGGDGDG